MSAVAVLVGYFLVEFPISGGFGFLARDAFHAVANLAAFAAVYAVFFLIGQRTHGAVAAFLAVCFAIGTANRYLILFKGQPIAPADLLAISTAADVASSYSFVPDAVIVVCAIVLAASLVALRFCPRARRTRRAAVVGTSCGVAVAVAFGISLASIDIERDLDCEVSSWDIGWSYREYGAALCFLARTQDLVPVEPDGYSPDAAEAILADYGADLDAIGDGARPNVVAIMNESFSDLSSLPGLEDGALSPAATRALSDDAVFSGDAYVSVVGAGTCNSEFEFLASATMASLGDGVYPYSVYDLSRADTLVSYFDSIGYGTTAVHPAEATNWRRDRVYASLGFDRFDDVSTFSDADILRYYPTDASVYDRALEILRESDEPQFVFEVTLQNHGGYSTGLVPDDDAVSVELADGERNAELDEFASLIQRSDADFAAFIDELRAFDEPVVVCFFGDHQPSFAQQPLPEASLDDGASVEQVQQRYAVPYVIWANFDTGLPVGTVADTSLNYLASMTVEAAGLPASPLIDFVGELRETVPAINANGYLDAAGAWHALGDVEAGSATADALSRYRIVQHENLFE